MSSSKSKSKSKSKEGIKSIKSNESEKEDDLFTRIKKRQAAIEQQQPIK